MPWRRAVPSGAPPPPPPSESEPTPAYALVRAADEVDEEEEELDDDEEDDLLDEGEPAPLPDSDAASEVEPTAALSASPSKEGSSWPSRPPAPASNSIVGLGASAESLRTQNMLPPVGFLRRAFPVTSSSYCQDFRKCATGCSGRFSAVHKARKYHADSVSSDKRTQKTLALP